MRQGSPPAAEPLFPLFEPLAQNLQQGRFALMQPLDQGAVVEGRGPAHHAANHHDQTGAGVIEALHQLNAGMAARPFPKFQAEGRAQGPQADQASAQALVVLNAWPLRFAVQQALGQVLVGPPQVAE